MTDTLDDAASTRERHDLLKQRHDEVYEAWTRQDAVVQAMRTSIDAGSGDDADRANAAAQLDEQDRLARALRQQLDDLARALERSTLGTYGRCDGCDGTIPAERLELFPAASHCLACKQRLEHH